MDDPLPQMKMLAEAVIPMTKPGYAIAVQPKSNGPVCGAAAGLACWVTATTKMKTAIKKAENPSQVSQPRFRKVRMDEKTVIMAVATKVKMTVQALCSERAFRAVEIDTAPAAVMRT
jgi:hypothetical protein